MHPQALQAAVEEARASQSQMAAKLAPLQQGCDELRRQADVQARIADRQATLMAAVSQDAQQGLDALGAELRRQVAEGLSRCAEAVQKAQAAAGAEAAGAVTAVAQVKQLLATELGKRDAQEEMRWQVGHGMARQGSRSCFLALPSDPAS